MNGMKYWIFGLWIGLAAFAVVPLAEAAAPDREARLVKQMEERLPALVKLKVSGKVGENNRALLEPREVLDRDARRLVAEENRDRMELYRLIAERTGAPLPNVQVKRAEDIRAGSPGGVWLQSPKGDWYRETK